MHKTVEMKDEAVHAASDAGQWTKEKARSLVMLSPLRASQLPRRCCRACVCGRAASRALKAGTLYRLEFWCALIIRSGLLTTHLPCSTASLADHYRPSTPRRPSSARRTTPRRS